MAATQKLDTPCIECTGGRLKSGYGRAQYRSKQILAHRLAFILAHGLQPKDIKNVVIRHRCDNPPCINPAHLERGSVQDNLRDMADRGRRVRGELVGNSKLTEPQVHEIRAAYRPYSKDANQHVLAKAYGVSQSEISHVINGARWAHLQAKAS